VENLDLAVLRALRDWRCAGQRAVLATVVRTWGSSPRPIGSIMALCEGGLVVGSVSGGCIEDDLIYRFAQGHPPTQRPPELLKYGIDADEAHRFGLPCGGTLELMLEFNPDGPLLDELVRRLDNGELLRRRVRLADGRARLASADAGEALSLDDAELCNTFGPAYRMLLIGAGQLTQYVAAMAQFSGFTVTVCDPREEYSRGWSLPRVPLATGMPDDVVASFRPDQRSCVIALTHDPKLDDLALLRALETEAFYVGAIGSRRNNEARRARLRDHFGLTNAQSDRLRGPIGLYIGSKTPAEIAISLMAEVLAVKNGVQLPRDMAVAHAKQQLEAGECALQAGSA
jgi:xanthine dehydrogenase accessory factor